MKKEQINIRDPFVLYENGKYYLYGSRAKNFACKSGGFDVYVSDDLVDWSEPTECFDSTKHGLNRDANWAPEVHKYKRKYYMLATFTQENGIKGCYSLVSDDPMGPFVPCSRGALTPSDWECLDGTLYIDESDTPYLIFCHEHAQITDGTICYAKLNESLDSTVGDVVTLFAASSCEWVDPVFGTNFVTDGPFMYRSKSNGLFMIWSSFIKGKYAELAVKFKDNRLGSEFEHIRPLLDNDGGHGMIFADDKKTYLVYHSPNEAPLERPEFREIEDKGDFLLVL